MIMMLKLLLLNIASVFAQEAEHAVEHLEHEAVTIPWGSLFVQAFNFIFLFGLLFFLLRKAVKAHFADRAQTYRELVDRAENARKEAEKTHAVMKDKLAKLETSAAQSAHQAKTEADALRAKLMEEAKQLSKKMEQEAQRTAALEIEKAKATLRAELLGKAIEATEEKLKKSLGTSDQKKLQNEFAEKIEVVGG
jgi:F-type H+-transporting ATPase subunit b